METELYLKVRPRLHACLESHFNLSELKTLAFKLGVQYESLDHSRLDDLSRELILYFERKNNLRCLIEQVIGRCPSEELLSAMASLRSCSPDTKLHVIDIRSGVQGEIPADLLEALAKCLRTTPDKIRQIYAISGTTHRLISVPEAALAEITPSLNQELKSMGVISVTPFDSLNRIARITWRVLVIYLGIPIQSLMQMDFYWEDAIRIIRESELAYKIQQAVLPKEAKYFYCAGAILLYMRRWKEAIVSFTKALEAVPQGFAMARLKRGLTYDALGRTTAALADYDAALSLDPNLVQAYNGRGAIQVGKGYLKRALEDFGKAIEVNPQFPVSYLNHGATLYRLRRYGEAIADFNIAINLDPNSKQAYLGRGLTLARLGRDREALKDFDRARELDPEDARVYRNRGIILERLQRYEEALQDYNFALALQPDDERLKALVEQARDLARPAGLNRYPLLESKDEPVEALTEGMTVTYTDVDFYDDSEQRLVEEEDLGN